MIHICFPLHDAGGTYSKYLGTAICSLLEHTDADLCIHILHDETLSKQNRYRFEELAARYRKPVIFYAVPSCKFRVYQNLAGSFTIGTLFRLMIPEILPRDVERLIYLDADLLVLLDIRELWELPLGGKLMAARVDMREDRWLCDVAGLTSHEEYFNAGVLLLDLAAMRRQYRLLEQCCAFFREHPACQYADQDAMNALFRGQVRWMPERYNRYTKMLRRQGISALGPAIYHFAGDIVDLGEMEIFDRAFLSYWCKTPWATSKIGENALASLAMLAHKKTVALQAFFRRMSCPSNKKIIFGSKSVLVDRLCEAIPLFYPVDWYLDNDKDLQGTKKDGMPVLSPEFMFQQPRASYFIIVLSQKFYRDIREQLEGYGMRENEDFIDGRLLLTQREGGCVIFHEIENIYEA